MVRDLVCAPARGGRRVRTARRLVAALLASLLVPLVACDRSDPQWQAVDLPGPGRVVTLTGTPDGVLVGRYDPDARSRPSIHVLARDGTGREIPMTTGWEGSGREAELTSVSLSGDDAVAIGGVRSGAHSNVRWTVWSGDADRLVEQPQRFETFGGWDAGALTGTAVSAAGPMILGSWVSADHRGMDVAVWERRGTRWVRPSRLAGELRATATRQPSPGAITALPRGYLAVGWVTVLGREIRDEAVLWTAASPSGPWRAIPFPATASAIQRPTAIDCTRDRCAVAGRRGDDVVLWRVRLEGGVPAGISAARTVEADVLRSPGATIAVAATPRVDTVARSEGDSTTVVQVRGEEAGPGTDLPGRLAAMAAEPSGTVLIATTDADGRSRSWRSPGSG